MIIKNDGVNKKRTGDSGGDLAWGHSPCRAGLIAWQRGTKLCICKAELKNEHCSSMSIISGFGRRNHFRRFTIRLSSCKNAG